MIKSITPVGKYTMVMGAQPPGTYLNHHSGLQGLGNVRYNTVAQTFETWDGNMWMQLNQANAQIGLSPEAESLLDWAKNKKAQEDNINQLAEQHPGIKDLLEKLNLMIALVDKGERNDSK